MSQTKGNAINIIRHCNRGASDSLRHPDKSFHLTASLSIVVLCTFICNDNNCHTLHTSTQKGTGNWWILRTSLQRSTAGCSSCSRAHTSQLPAIPSSLRTASARTACFWKLARIPLIHNPCDQCSVRAGLLLAITALLLLKHTEVLKPSSNLCFWGWYHKAGLIRHIQDPAPSQQDITK